jgi:xylulose-5-phosphate/fructose-6-phosphate phosphoketolase
MVTFPVGASIRTVGIQQSISEILMPDSLSPDLLQKMHPYRRAVNCPSVGQIYPQDNPLHESPLRLEHIKPRLLGYPTPGLNPLYVPPYPADKENDLNMMCVIGPGHGGPSLVPKTYLEGSYTEHYPAIERSRNGLQRRSSFRPRGNFGRWQRHAASA